MKTISRRKKGYFLLAIIFIVAALSTSLAYIINQSVSGSGDTNHGTEVSLSVSIDDFSDQILIPQNAIPTISGETKTLNITGSAVLDDKATEQDAVNVTLTYTIKVDGNDQTDSFNITDATESLSLTGSTAESFLLKVSLKEGVRLDDGAVITVEVTANLVE